MTRQARRAPEPYSPQLSGQSCSGVSREKYSTLLARATRRPPIIAPGPHLSCPAPPYHLLPSPLPGSAPLFPPSHASDCRLPRSSPHVYYQNPLFASRHMYPYFTASVIGSCILTLPVTPTFGPHISLLDPPRVVELEARIRTTTYVA